MNYRLLENYAEIRDEFLKNFVLSWEEFQTQQKEWIAEMANNNYPINVEWYEQSYMWDKMNPDFPRVSMAEALVFLKEHDGTVLFMSEKGEGKYYQGKRLVGVIAETDVAALASKIEQEWFDLYRFAAQNMYDEEAVLTEDLYVFDYSMKWCVVFTHETTDWESEIDNPLKAAESRYCIICNV